VSRPGDRPLRAAELLSQTHPRAVGLGWTGPPHRRKAAPAEAETGAEPPPGPSCPRRRYLSASRSLCRRRWLLGSLRRSRRLSGGVVLLTRAVTFYRAAATAARATTLAAAPCSSVCSRDSVDRESGARWRETPWLPGQSRYRTPWTRGTFVDDGRLTHNPEVAGSNPAPATNFRSSRPFPITERAFCVTGNVTKWGAGAVRRGLTGETGWHAARQRGTRWTTSPAISGCFSRSSTGVFPRQGLRLGLARRRTISISAGYAALRLPGLCRRASVTIGPSRCRADAVARD